MDTAKNMTDGLPPEEDPLKIAQFDSSSEESALGEVLDDSFHGQVTEQLRDLLSPKTSWRRNLLVLGATVALFVVLGLVESTLSFVMILVGVLLVHESGHYLGMRLFGYRNVRMFFIPLFGAAVSGIGTQVSPLKKGIVLLLGPVPGIVLGTILAFVYRAYPGYWLYEVGILLVLLNAFNLLPLLPLDGGRLFHLVLFSRNRYIEAAFSLLASLGLFGIGWMLSAWLLVGLGALMLFVVSRGLSISRIAKAIGSGPLPCSVESEDDVPPAYVAAIAERVLIEKPQLKKLDAGPRYVAQSVRSVWEKLSNDPPGIVTSLLLLSVYFFALVISPLALLALFEPVSVVAHDVSGQPVREDRYFTGKLLEWTEVGSNSLYHGQHEWHGLGDELLKTEGRWDHGFKEGDWSYYKQEEITQVVTFDHGKIVSARFPEDDGWTTLLRDELDDEYLSQFDEQPDQPQGPQEGWRWPELLQ